MTPGRQPLAEDDGVATGLEHAPGGPGALTAWASRAAPARTRAGRGLTVSTRRRPTKRWRIRRRRAPSARSNAGPSMAGPVSGGFATAGERERPGR